MINLQALQSTVPGNVYVAGYTNSTDFPLATLGSLPAGSTHVFVAKFDPTGSNLFMPTTSAATARIMATPLCWTAPTMYM